MKLVVKPPSRTTTSLGRPVQMPVVPAARGGLADRVARSQRERETGAHDAGERRHQDALGEVELGDGLLLLRLGHFPFLGQAASAAMAMPSRQTQHAGKGDLAGVVAAICPMVSATGMLGMNVLKIGGTSVPNAAQ